VEKECIEEGYKKIKEWKTSVFALNSRTQQSWSDKLFYVVPHLHD